jgi:hypothetical protein
MPAFLNLFLFILAHNDSGSDLGASTILSSDFCEGNLVQTVLAGRGRHCLWILRHGFELGRDSDFAHWIH